MGDDEVLNDGRVSIDVGSGVSRRTVMKQLGMVGALAGVAGCVGLEGDDEEDPDGLGDLGAAETRFGRHPMVAPPGWDASHTESESGETTRECVFVIQNPANEFFIPMMVGFHDALNVFGWEGEVTGPESGEVADQISTINSVVDSLSAGDVLVTTILDDSAYIEPIQNAMENDVVVVNGHTTPDVNDWNYDAHQEHFEYNGQEMIVPHVGIRDLEGGIEMAAEAYQRMQEKIDKDEYTVLLTNELPDNPSVTRRTNPGAKSFFEEQDDVTIHDTINPDADVADARDSIVTVIEGNPEIDAVVCSAFWGAVGAGQALDDGEIDGPMVICGFDLVEPLLVGIDEGYVDFTVGQDPYGQGFMSVPPAWMYLNRGIEMKHIEWGVSVVDESNVDFALERRSWEDLLSWQESNYDFL